MRSKTFSLLSVIAISALMIMGSYIPSSALIYPPADPPILLSIEGSSCVSVFEGIWNGVDTCTIDEGFSVGDNFDVEISPGVTAVLQSGESIIINDSEFTINNGATLIIEDGAYLIINNGGTFIDSGTLTVNGGPLDINSGGALEINSGGVLDIISDGVALDINSGGVLDVNSGGVLTVNRPTNTTNDIDVVIGVVDINGGVVNAKCPHCNDIDIVIGLFDINSGGVLDISCGTSSALVGGTGTVNIICGSITVEALDGTIESTFFADDGRTATTSMDGGNSLTFYSDTFTFTTPDTNPDTIVVNVGGLEIPLVPDSNIKPVNIDVKPGEKNPATINLKIEKIIAVAILGDASLDVSQIDRTLSTLKFGDSLSATPATATKTSLKDVNLDGRMDLVAQFKLSQTNLSLEDTMGCITGKMKETFGGATIEGCDTIRLIQK